MDVGDNDVHNRTPPAGDTDNIQGPGTQDSHMTILPSHQSADRGIDMAVLPNAKTKVRPSRHESAGTHTHVSTTFSLDMEVTEGICTDFFYNR